MEQLWIPPTDHLSCPLGNKPFPLIVIWKVLGDSVEPWWQPELTPTWLFLDRGINSKYGQILSSGSWHQKKCCILPLNIRLSLPFLSQIMSSDNATLGPVPCHDFYWEVSGGVVVRRVDSYLVESKFCKVGSFCSIEGYRFWLEEVSKVRVDFLELEIESPFDFERVRPILVPDRCFLQTPLFSFPSQVWWIWHLSSLQPWSQLPSILPVKYRTQVYISSSCLAAMVSSLGLEESFRGSHQAFFLSLLSSFINEIPCSEPFPSSPMEEGTRLSEDSFSPITGSTGGERFICSLALMTHM